MTRRNCRYWAVLLLSLAPSASSAGKPAIRAAVVFSGKLGSMSGKSVAGHEASLDSFNISMACWEHHAWDDGNWGTTAGVEVSIFAQTPPPDVLRTILRLTATRSHW